MDTNDLIEGLSRDLKPVRPLASPATRALGFVFITTLLMASLIFLSGGMRADFEDALATPRFLAENAAMLAAGILATFSAFHLSVPDTRIRRPVLIGLIGAALLWLFLALSCCMGLETHGHPSDHAGLHCLRDLSVILVLPVVLGGFMISRAAPVWTGWAGFGTVLAVASFSGIGIRFMCPNDAPAHLLYWHFLPVIALSTLGIILGKIIFARQVKKR